jgi:hypothetical protein
MVGGFAAATSGPVGAVCAACGQGDHPIPVILRAGSRLAEPARTDRRGEDGSVLMPLHSPGLQCGGLQCRGLRCRGLRCRGLRCRGLRCRLLRLGLGTAQFLAADPDGGDRDEQSQQRDPRGNHERTRKADRQGVIVDGRRRDAARPRHWPARLRGGRRRVRDLSSDAVRDGRPGDGAEQREPDRAAYLLGGVEQAGGDTGVLLATWCRATRASGTNTRPSPNELTSMGPIRWLA